MQVLRLSLSLITLTVLLRVTSPAQGIKYPDVLAREETAAGELSVVVLERGWELRLNDRVIHRGEDPVAPDILEHIRRPVPPFTEVIVLQLVAGTYCNGGPFRFLGIRRDGSYYLTREVGGCSARPPVVKFRSGVVRVSVGGGYGNNPLPGDPYLPGGTWIFKDGKISKTGRRPTRD